MPARRITPTDKLLADLDKVRNMYASGYTYAQIGQEFGISEISVSRAAKKNELIQKALQKGKKEAILDVEKQLYTLAMGGFVVKKKKTIWIPDKNDPSKLVIDRVEESEDVLAPNIAAQVFYLKNNAPDRYQDKRVLETPSFQDNLGVLKTLMDTGEEASDEQPKEGTDVQG